VQPQIVVPMEPAAERRALEQMSERDRFLRPTTQKATSQPTTADTQQGLDAQLQRAVDTMIALAVLEHSRRESAMAPSVPAPKIQIRLESAPGSQPLTTSPATGPAQ